MDGFMSIYSLPFFSNNKKGPLDFDSSNNLNLWLDASDPSGNGAFFSSDASLNFWKDKSKYANHATGYTTSDVTTNLSYVRAGFNSNYPTFDFTGNGNRFAGSFVNSPTAGNSNITGQKMRVFVVGTVNNKSNTHFSRFIGFSTIYKEDDYNGTGKWGFLRQSNTGMGAYRNGKFAANNPPGYDIPLLWEAWFDGGNSYATFINNGAATYVNYTSTEVFNIKFYAVGHNTNPADGPATLSGKISEILVYNTDLTTTEVQKIEGYLSHKWGLHEKLPLIHPYRYLAP
jgi:hypothetical protein